jgi:hypothetical protein
MKRVFFKDFRVYNNGCAGILFKDSILSSTLRRFYL